MQRHPVHPPAYALVRCRFCFGVYFIFFIASDRSSGWIFFSVNSRFLKKWETIGQAFQISPSPYDTRLKQLTFASIQMSGIIIWTKFPPEWFNCIRFLADVAQEFHWPIIAFDRKRKDVLRALCVGVSDARLLKHDVPVQKHFMAIFVYIFEQALRQLR